VFGELESGAEAGGVKDVSRSESVLIVLPTVWWAVAALARSLYSGWNHDPRFFRLYGIPLALFAWSSRGTSYRPAEAVAAQDFLVALLMSVVLASILMRSRAWWRAHSLRMSCAVLSVLLPWEPFVSGFDRPEWYTVATITFACGYAVAVVAAFLAPVSQGMRAMLFSVALAGGVTFSMWRVERRELLLASGIVATFVLVAYCLAQTVTQGARRRRTTRCS
jgi:hypothetical protein